MVLKGAGEIVFVRYLVLTATIMNVAVLWDVSPRSLVENETSLILYQTIENETEFKGQR